LSERLILPGNVPDDLLLPESEKNEEFTDSVIPRTADSLALPSKIYPFPIHSNGDHDYAFNNPCPNEKAIIKIKKTENESITL